MLLILTVESRLWANFNGFCYPGLTASLGIITVLLVTVRLFKSVSITYGHVLHLRRIVYSLCPLYRSNTSFFLSVNETVKPIKIFARASTREWRIHYKSYFKAPFLRYRTFEESAFRRSIRATKNLRCINRWEDCENCRGENEEFPHHNSVQPLHVLDCADYSAVNFRNNVYVMLLNLLIVFSRQKGKPHKKRQLYSIGFLRYALWTNCRQTFY